MPLYRRPRTLELGGFRAVKRGMPPALGDVYYATMEMGWPAFVALVSLVFLLLNLGFGAVYALLPGTIANMTPGSLADGFFFSVETLGTVGYGNMAPATRIGHAIAAVEILAGLFFSATITGLIFARFARPRTSFVFSRYAVIGRHEGRRILMVRLASTRLRPIADVSAELSWLERREQGHGQIYRHLVPLPLIRAHNPQLTFSWTLMHEIEEGSAMLAALEGEGEFRLTVSVSGIDTLLASQALGGQAYMREDVLAGQEYDDMIDDSSGVFQFDLAKLHDVHPRPTPQ